MSAPLTNSQKRHLSQLARRAWEKLGPELDGLPETDYRHQQVAQATGKLGLRCCTQSDYKLVEGHFLELLGHHGAAFNANLRAATEGRRIAAHKVMAACREFGFQLSYAAAICSNQHHGKTMDDLDEKQLWNLFYTIRNRGLARRKKQFQPVPA